MAKVYADPGPCPENATPVEREYHRVAQEKFLTEGGRAGVTDVPVAIDPTDKRLKELRREHNRFLDLHSPMKASLWLALLRPAKDVIHDAEMSRRFQEAQRAGQTLQEHTAPDRPAIIEIGQQLVAAALRGDVSAIDRIADRIEGKAGLRVGDESEDNPERRKQATDITERVIRQLTQKRIEDMEAAKVVDVTPEVVKEK